MSTVPAAGPSVGGAEAEIHSTASRTGPFRIGFVLEYSLGHVTHAENLKAVMAADRSVLPAVIQLPFEKTPVGPFERLPFVQKNWTLRASLGAYLGLREQSKMGKLQAIFFHTQITSLLASGYQKRIPSVVSLDATPTQIDAMGPYYEHGQSSSQEVENFKKRLTTRSLVNARKIVTWSRWAKESVVSDYGIPADKVTVIPPGIDLGTWEFGADRPARPDSISADNPLRVLFVGGDFYRKGGDLAAEAALSLPYVHLHVVTKSEDLGKTANRLIGQKRLTVYRDTKPNDPKLRQLFAEADVFLFPTRADCLPIAVLEALAAGLPVIGTNVGAMSEAVVENQNGVLVPNAFGLTGNMTEGSTFASVALMVHALEAFAEDIALRDRMGRRSREIARSNFDARKNYRRLLDLLKEISA
jgi:glycosyltransferase involved in cell wall biosynthesis